MSTGKVPLAVGERLAAKLLPHLASACERIEIAGSIRRKKPMIGDVELVAIPKLGRDLFGEIGPTQDLLAARLDALVRDGLIFKTPIDDRLRPAWGTKYKKFWCKLNDHLGEIQVDLFICEARNWGNIFTIRTGCSEFSEALVTRIKHLTPYRQQEGFLVHQVTGEVIPVGEEADYFRLAGAAWVEPEHRVSASAVRAGSLAPASSEGKDKNDTLSDLLTGNVSSETTSDARAGESQRGIVYTCDQDVRAAIRARMEARAGIG